MYMYVGDTEGIVYTVQKYLSIAVSYKYCVLPCRHEIIAMYIWIVDDTWDAYMYAYILLYEWLAILL